MRHGSATGAQPFCKIAHRMHSQGQTQLASQPIHVKINNVENTIFKNVSNSNSTRTRARVVIMS